MSTPRAEHEQALVELATELRFEDLPDAAVDATLALVLDGFSCCLVGMEMDWTRRLRDVVAGPSLAPPAGPATHIYGDLRPVDPAVAALVNGTAAHGFDLDDLHFPTMSHPGCVIIPAAVAMADALQADGRDLLAAVAAGYEPMLRTGMAAGLRYGELGFHATGVLGPLGSATAASRLLSGRGSGAVLDAIGLAASMGAGVKAFNEVGPGMVKRLHAGRAAESGILAARLAEAGYAGPRRALSARFGLARVLAMGEEADIAALDRGLGDPLLVQDIYLKPYAACGALHGAVAAGQQLADALPGLDQAEVREVVVGVSPRAIAQNSDPEPADVMAAQYSTEVAVAIAVLGGATDPGRFVAVGADPHDPARELARRTVLEVDAQAAATYPDPMEGVVTLTLRDGTTHTRRGSSSPASSRGWVVATAKFDAVAAARLTSGQRDDLLAAVRALADGAPVSACLRALAAAA